MQTQITEKGLPFKRLANLNKPEWKQGIVGVLSSALLGLQMPGMAVCKCIHI
jgi:hypothetical protein